RSWHTCCPPLEPPARAHGPKDNLQAHFSFYSPAAIGLSSSRISLKDIFLASDFFRLALRLLGNFDKSARRGVAKISRSDICLASSSPSTLSASAFSSSL